MNIFDVMGPIMVGPPPTGQRPAGTPDDHYPRAK